MTFTKRLGGFGGIIFRGRGMLIINIPSMGLTNTPSNSGRGYEGQNFQTYLTSDHGYNVNIPGITINITIPANYVLGGYAPSALPALDLNTGFTNSLHIINIYNYGKIIGGGGSGGAGASGDNSGNPGSSGTSGILATLCQATVNLYNYGEIRGGGAGGGGGGGGNTSGGKGGYFSTTGGSGGSGAGLNINPSLGINQSYSLFDTPLSGVSGGTNAGLGGSGGAYETNGFNGSGGVYTQSGGGKGGGGGGTFSTIGGSGGLSSSYAINGISRVTIVENTGTIGATSG